MVGSRAILAYVKYNGNLKNMAVLSNIRSNGVVQYNSVLAQHSPTSSVAMVDGDSFGVNHGARCA